jgi:hypothetical protein
MRDMVDAYEHNNTWKEGTMSEEREARARISTTAPEELVIRLRHHLLDRRQTFAMWLEHQMRIYLDMQERSERKKEGAV